MNAIIAVALPIFAIIATGFATGRYGYVNGHDSQALNRFVFRVAMPVALFALTSQTEPLTLDDLPITLVYFTAALTTLGLSYFIARRFFSLPRPDAGVHAFAATLGNAVFLGLPIAQNIPGWGRLFVVLMLVEGLVIITIASVLIAARVDESASDRKTPIREIIARPFKNPLVVGSLGGFLFGLAGLQLPEVAHSFLTILGRAAGPTALFSLGLFLSVSAIDRHKVMSLPILQIVLFKMAFLPLIFFTGLYAAGITDPAIIGPCLLFTLVPSGIGVFIQASARGRYVSESATAIAVTTSLSIVTISSVLYFFA